MTYCVHFDRRHIQAIATHLEGECLQDSGFGHACHRANLLRSSAKMQACVARQQRCRVAWERLQARSRYQLLSELHDQMISDESLVALYRRQVADGLIQPDFHPGMNFFHHLEADADYINYFLFLIHDWLHLLTDSPFDFLGELKLMSALVANVSYPAYEVYGMSRLVKKLVSFMLEQKCNFVITEDRIAYEAMRSLVAGYASGAKFSSFLGLDLKRASTVPLAKYIAEHQLSVL